MVSGTRHQARPASLAEVAAWAGEAGSIDAWLREFLDEFYLARDPRRQQAMLDAEPRPLENARANAYLAAVAEHLSRRYKLKAPRWAFAPDRFLRRPFFPAGLESLKATVIAGSPTAFRRRMIFVERDPLYRPRRDAVGIGEAPRGGDAP